MGKWQTYPTARCPVNGTGKRSFSGAGNAIVRIRSGAQRSPIIPTVEEIVVVMRASGDRPDGLRLRGVIVVLWRAGLRMSEAFALAESDLDRTRGAVLVRRGKGGKRREVGMDRGAWDQLEPWLQVRARLPVYRSGGRRLATGTPPIVKLHRTPKCGGPDLANAIIPVPSPSTRSVLFDQSVTVAAGRTAQRSRWARGLWQ
jgi:integrase